MTTDSYDRFKALVNDDVRERTTDIEQDWLRSDANLIRFATELKRLESTVSNQLEMSERAWRALPAGDKRDYEQEKAEKAAVARNFFRQKVRERLAEVTDLIGHDAAPITVGQLRAVLDAALDALDVDRIDSAVEYLEALLDLVDPPQVNEVA